MKALCRWEYTAVSHRVWWINSLVVICFIFVMQYDPIGAVTIEGVSATPTNGDAKSGDVTPTDGIVRDDDATPTPTHMQHHSLSGEFPCDGVHDCRSTTRTL